MLQRAAHLLSATQKEEAWHLVGLYQQTQPRAFLHVCHRILASFLELTHDYFDQGWPLNSRLMRLPSSSHGSQRSRRHRRQRTKTFTGLPSYWAPDELDEDFLDEADMVSVFHNHVCMSPVYHHVTYCTSLSPAGNHAASTSKQLTSLGKLRSTLAAKRLFKQILPSRPRTPSTTKLNYFDHTTTQQKHQLFDDPTTPTNLPTPTKNSMTTGPTGRTHMGTLPGFHNGTRVPLAPIHMSHASSSCTGPDTRSIPACQSRICATSSTTDSCCNTDSLICRCLIEYMLDNPGLFRIPGNAQRIRDLWVNLRGFFQTPYIRIPQPDPEYGLECEVVSTRCDLYSLLDAYSPHDLATLLLRCLTTCSQVTTYPVTSSHGSGLGSGANMGGYSSVSSAMPGYSINGSNEAMRTGYQFTAQDDPGFEQSIGGLIHPEASELCFLATQLQYGLEQVQEPDQYEDWIHMLCEARQLLTYRIVLQLLLPNPERFMLFNLLRLFKKYGLEQVQEPDQYEDWIHMLCEARQLLTYRIVLQLLLPNPERFMLFNLLRLFKKVSTSHSQSRMSAECLARCTAVAVFGAPAQMTSPDVQHNHPCSVDSPLRWRIDTLTNLIHMVDDLDQLPGVVYSAVRDRLRVRLGHSPIPRVQVQTGVEGFCSLTTTCGSYSSNSSVRCTRPGLLSVDRENRYKNEAEAPAPSTCHHPCVGVKSRADQPSVTSTLVHRSSARASLHRAKSSLDTGSRQRGARGASGTTEPFKLWRRQKTAQVIPSAGSVGGRALTKARSVLLFSPQKSSSSGNERTAS
ncbi:unnamed protein product [Echinostoma caproni]|uniref:Rho-GAP domain-containing protein n=1 Tax=Echinostoma caproni TaxID=27848 RepID=A0A183AC77_9TREM|nr:unnamed protein product [Echinostoma caproni]